MQKQFYVYEVECTHTDFNGMKYIGSHFGKITDSYIGSGSYLKSVIKLIGKAWFEKTILKVCNDKDDMISCELELLERYDCANDGKYFNLMNSQAYAGNLGMNWYYCPHTRISVCSNKPLRGFVRGNANNLGRKAHNRDRPLLDSQREKLSDEWEVTMPDGEKVRILNMLAFCKDRNLNPSAMSAVARGKRRHYKGFRCKKLTNKRDVDYAYKDYKPCIDFSFRGKSGGDNNNATPVSVDGIMYSCMTEASRLTGLSLYKLRKLKG